MGLFDDNTPGGLSLGSTPHSARSLADILTSSRPEVKNLYFLNKTIKLDGYTFIGCRFDGCQLELTSTNFDIINCVIDPSTVVNYGGAVIKVIQLFTSRYDWAPTYFQSIFTPRKNPDGTITISDKTV